MKAIMILGKFLHFSGARVEKSTVGLQCVKPFSEFNKSIRFSILWRPEALLWPSSSSCEELDFSLKIKSSDVGKSGCANQQHAFCIGIKPTGLAEGPFNQIWWGCHLPIKRIWKCSNLSLVWSWLNVQFLCRWSMRCHISRHAVFFPYYGVVRGTTYIAG